jgi:hypothetical protein
MVAATCFDIILPSSGSVPSAFERFSIEEQSIKYLDGRVVSSDVVRGDLRSLSTAPQLSIAQKALGKLPEDGNVMPKHVEATIHNY